MDSLRVLVIAPPDAEWLAPLRDLPEGAELKIGNDQAFLAAEAPRSDVILNCDSSGKGFRAIWPIAGKTRWVHSLSAGVENQVFPDFADSPVPLTNGRGVYRESLGEFVLAAILFFAKDFRRLLRSQAARRWEQFDCEVIEGRTVGIAGYGEIGRAVARRAKALDMKVIGCRRRPEPDGVADEVLPNERLSEMLSRSDYVAVAAPLTPDTRSMIGQREFEAMQRHAVLINVGRGPVVDEAALVQALRERRIRGAALDVYNEEPLPESHPLWSLDNVLLSPHCADHVEGWLEAAVHLFVRNYRRFAAGEPLLNIVDKKAGY
jgi:phosphoglycerate dehydrogenase-like enzyme